jgi:hypothetical protein
LSAARPLLLGLCGFASALIDAALDTDEIGGYYAAGLTFGALLVVYFAAVERRRNPFALAMLLMACVAAYPLAILAAIAGMREAHAVLRSAGSLAVLAGFPWLPFFAAGFVGASIVLAAGRVLLGPRWLEARSWVRIFVLAVLGGILGVIAGAALRIRTGGVYSGSAVHFVIWRPGAAALLGVLLNWERAPRPATLVGGDEAKAESRRRFAAQAAIVAISVAVIAFLSWAASGALSRCCAGAR